MTTSYSFPGEYEVSTLKHANPAHDEFLSTLLVPGESVKYHDHDMYITSQRIIRYRENKHRNFFHFFYHTFEDLDLSSLEAIKAKNVMNMRLFVIGLIVMFLGPIAAFISFIPGISFIGLFLLYTVVMDIGLGGLLLLGVILVAASLIIRDRYIEFHGGGTVIRSRGFYDEELVKVRTLQKALLGRKK